MRASLRRARAVAFGRRLRWPRRAGYAVLAIGVVAWGAFFVAVRAGEFPLQLLDRASATSLAVMDSNGVVLRQEATSAGLRESWVSVDKISPHLVHATL